MVPQSKEGQPLFSGCFLMHGISGEMLLQKEKILPLWLPLSGFVQAQANLFLLLLTLFSGYSILKVQREVALMAIHLFRRLLNNEGALVRHPHFNLNLIVNRPDGLIKEGK